MFTAVLWLFLALWTLPQHRLSYLSSKQEYTRLPIRFCALLTNLYAAIKLAKGYTYIDDADWRRTASLGEKSCFLTPLHSWDGCRSDSFLCARTYAALTYQNHRLRSEHDGRLLKFSSSSTFKRHDFFLSLSVSACPNPDIPVYGELKSRSSTAAEVKCLAGYETSDSTKKSCVKGSWIGSKVTCKRELKA